jgi:hypothetical protein
MIIKNATWTELHEHAQVVLVDAHAIAGQDCARRPTTVIHSPNPAEAALFGSGGGARHHLPNDRDGSNRCFLLWPATRCQLPRWPLQRPATNSDLLSEISLKPEPCALRVWRRQRLYNAASRLGLGQQDFSVVSQDDAGPAVSSRIDGVLFIKYAL